ncbi:MjaI restriction endonuclease [Thermoflavifilum aggregans]|uniref:MjaI restriction endonuclease n=1 Tax=Thermoflavifilum aggregans TaxID=454188 RepID=A0A2M9CS43_9BACT|nr:MjaI family restriction endonuclease [Thermoflavifilum aggregans]PJJ74723.1 MjaI restriction endonuclease [Thermoflavifilum aggregans]
MKFLIKNSEIFSDIEAEKPKFNTYVSPLLNLANQFAQATRPHKVGKMSELIKQFTGNKLSEWEEFYLKNYPNAISRAVKEIRYKINEFKETIENITDETIEDWVKDLVIVKTFAGLRFQMAILKKISESLGGVEYRLATLNEESKGIDGYIGKYAVSIKPRTYEGKQSLPEEIQADIIIYYKKTKNGIQVEFDEHKLKG